jgi:hypothetical protein
MKLSAAPSPPRPAGKRRENTDHHRTSDPRHHGRPKKVSQLRGLARCRLLGPLLGMPVEAAGETADPGQIQILASGLDLAPGKTPNAR